MEEKSSTIQQTDKLRQELVRSYIAILVIYAAFFLFLYKHSYAYQQRLTGLKTLMPTNVGEFTLCPNLCVKLNHETKFVYILIIVYFLKVIHLYVMLHLSSICLNMKLMMCRSC